MKLSLSTYNGATISTFGARIPGDNIGMDAKIISSDRVNDTTAYGGKSFSPSQFTIMGTITGAEGTARQSSLETLGGIFNARDGSLYPLVALDTNDSSRPYYINATPQHDMVVSGATFSIEMWSSDPVWRTVTAAAGTLSFTSGAGTVTVNNVGNVDAYPTFAVSPVSGVGNFRLQRHVIVYNPIGYPLHNYPIDLTNGGFNTQALVTGGTLLATGDDIRVQSGDVFIERWLGGMNTTTTKVWSTFDFSSGATGALDVALSASGNTYIQFADTPNNIAALNRMPGNGLVLIDNECIVYTRKNVSNRRLTISNAGRGHKNTTAASHSAGAVIHWVQFDIVLCFGNTSLGAPDQTDSEQPCFSLTNSTNTNWRYDSADSVFASEDGLRSGGWVPTKPKGKHCDWYTGNQGTAGIDPYTNMGAEIVNYQAGAIYRAETAQIQWTLHNPATFGTISSLGEKWVNGTATPWPAAKLLSSVNGETWVTEWTEAVPGTAATWTNWTNASEVLPSNTRFIRFEFMGAVGNKANAQANFEVNLGASGSMGVVMPSGNVPQVTLQGQQTAVYVNMTITNTTTGDAFTERFPLISGDTLTMDSENRTIAYHEHYYSPPELNSVRQEWLRLIPGNNVITYADTHSVAGTVLMTWNTRKNI